MIISSTSFFSIPFISTLLAIILAATLLFIRNHRINLSRNSPPGPWKLPIIGNIHQMVGDQPHRRLRDLARKYGPDVMRLQLGELSCIVISTPEAAKLVMKTHDIAFASRPYILATDVLFYGRKDIGFAPYGEYWRQLRKICTLELFSAKRVESFRHIREQEVSNLVASLALSCHAEAGKSGPVDLTRALFTVTSTVTSRAVFGKVQQLSGAFQTVLDNYSDATGGFKISDLYPSLTLLPTLTGFRAKLEKMREAADSVLDQIIDEHQLRRRAGMKSNDDYNEKEDLVDVLLNIQENQDVEVITPEVIKAVTLEIFIAGVDTAATTLEWTMSEMIKNSGVLEKAQREVREVFGDGENNNFNEARLHQLKYLDMVISESLRLHPPVPLLAPRENKDQKVELNSSYDIPMNTYVIVNAWAINRDSRYWTEAERFYPERFIDCPIDYNGTNFHFIPFGAGRRMCAGVSFGMAVVKLTLASLLFHFDWTLPAEQKSIDMTECFGMTLRRQYPLRLIPFPYGPVL
ncbi:unnamed protein product [Linum tenue]|uniref:Cytochrome P450 n=1 Tax=Linum tenue TaxID=586396 RepID=A0AAV0GR79_9ROSI|nr:unnamed protein product [Linum tenue]